MNVPSTDFVALVYIVPPSLHRCEPVSSLKRAADSLETAKFVDFWQVRRALLLIGSGSHPSPGVALSLHALQVAIGTVGEKVGGCCLCVRQRSVVK